MYPDPTASTPREPSLILSEIQAISKRIVHERRRANARQFKTVNDAIGFQRLHKDRERLQRELPPLRLI